jgi:hypothetical protein
LNAAHVVDGVAGRVGDPFDYSGLRVLLPDGQVGDRPALAVYRTIAQGIEGAVGVVLVVVPDQPAQAAVGEPSPRPAGAGGGRRTMAVP